MVQSLNDKICELVLNNHAAQFGCFCVLLAEEGRKHGKVTPERRHELARVDVRVSLMGDR